MGYTFQASMRKSILREDSKLRTLNRASEKIEKKLSDLKQKLQEDISRHGDLVTESKPKAA